MKEYDAYLFDADGTILDTRELIFRSFMHMGEVMGEKMPERDVLEGTVGLTLKKSLYLILGEGRPEDYYAKAGSVYAGFMVDNYQDYLKGFPGMAEALAELHRCGKKMAVVTSRKRPTLHTFLCALGLDSYFSILVTPESTEKHKPDPEPALFAMECLGVSPEESVFVGDAIFDIQCGKAAGMDTALVEWGGMEPSGWSVQPNFIAKKPGDLLPG